MPSHPLETSSSRTRLLDAAKRLFAAQGYEQSATSAIAREAGTSESQLMRYFGGKVGLLDAIFEDAWKHLNARVSRVQSAAGDSRAVLLASIQVIISSLARDQNLATLFLFEGRRLRGDEPRIKVSRGFVQFSDTIRGLVKRAQSARDLDATLDANALTSALIGASEAMVRDRLLAKSGGGRSFAEREIRRTLDAILTGFAAKSAPRRPAPARRAGAKR